MNYNITLNESEDKNLANQSSIRITPLGGIGEIGKNMTVIEYADEIIIMDCGLCFPREDMLGVDYVIPDITYLRENKHKIKAVLITHGHDASTRNGYRKAGWRYARPDRAILPR